MNPSARLGKPPAPAERVAKAERLRLIVTLGALLAVLASSARADVGPDPVFRFFQEEATATTALRRPAPTESSPLAVDVITAEEIKASGALNVWDLLRFRVGM